MNAPDFHAIRLKGIGSSDAAAACGVSPWCSPRELYEDKTGNAPQREESEPMRFGTLLEPVILAEFARRTGLAIERPPVLFSEEHPFMLAHLDARTGDAVVEAKTARTADGWGIAGSADIPLPYLCQTQHQMVVTGLRLAFVPVLIAGSDFRIYEVPFDGEFAELIISNEAALWDRVQRRDPPPINPDTAGALAIIRRAYPGTSGERIRATAAEEHWRAVLVDATERRERYALVADGAKAHLELTMEDAAELEFADGALLRRKQVTRKGYVVEPSIYMDVRLIKPKE